MQRTHDRVQGLAPTLVLSRELNSLVSNPKTCAEAFANLTCNFPACRTLSRPLASAARRRAATLAPVARCTFDPQPSFEPMTDREEPVMTGASERAMLSLLDCCRASSHTRIPILAVGRSTQTARKLVAILR